MGSAFMYYNIDYVAPGPATANFNFNVSSAVAYDSVAVEVVMPGSTAYGGTFPDATYAIGYSNSTGTSYSYMLLDPVSRQDLGTASFAGSVFYRSNGTVEMQLPCTMGTTWTDTFNGSSIPASNWSDDDGILTGQCNGYGTLELPSGTFINVLRIEAHKTLMRVNQTTGDTTLMSLNTVSYMTAGVPIWLFQSYTIASTVGQNQFTDQKSVILGATSVGVAENSGAGVNVHLFPNPASDAFTLLFDALVSSGSTISLMDAVGRQVSELQPTSAEVRTMNFNVSSMPRGMYIVRVVDAQGRSRNMPLVLN
ncbi:MAG: T9SS type A sorting domain-containing protein [Flavobacteriales bacterium]